MYKRWEKASRFFDIRGIPHRNAVTTDSRRSTKTTKHGNINLYPFIIIYQLQDTNFRRMIMMVCNFHSLALNLSSIHGAKCWTSSLFPRNKTHRRPTNSLGARGAWEVFALFIPAYKNDASLLRQKRGGCVNQDCSSPLFSQTLLSWFYYTNFPASLRLLILQLTSAWSCDAENHPTKRFEPSANRLAICVWELPWIMALLGQSVRIG